VPACSADEDDEEQYGIATRERSPGPPYNLGPVHGRRPVAGVAQVYYSGGVSTTTVRLDDHDELLLDKLAPAYGGRSNVIRQALRTLSAEVDRQQALEDFLAEWQAEAGPLDDGAVDAMARRYGL